MARSSASTRDHADATQGDVSKADYDRLMMRAAVASLMVAVVADRRSGGLKLKDIAEALGCDKSQVSRWFAGDPPNWRLDTIAHLARVLDVDIQVTAIDRRSGRVYGPTGPITEATTMRAAAE